MTVAIFETHHFEVTYASIRLFDHGENKLIIFTYGGSYKQLRYLLGPDVERYEWIVKEDHESRRTFIGRMRKECLKRDVDLLLLNTVEDNFILYAALVRSLRHVRVIVTLHDVNNFFRFKFSWNLRRWVRYIGRRRLIRAANDFNVISLAMVGHLQQLLPAGKQVHSLPGGVFEQKAISAPPTGKIRIVVPGTVDERRRDYKLVFDVLEACEQNGVAVEVVLLGAFYSNSRETVGEKCKAYTGNNLRFYTNKIIDQPEFDKVLKSAHVIWCPSVLETLLLDDVTEVYGKSITSGNLFDAVRHARPFMIPAALAVPMDVEAGCLRYRSVEDIVQILKRMLHDASYYETVAQHALQGSLSYTVQKVRARNPSLF